jgi:N-acetylmuramoyl-L-alanine amidase
MGVVVVSGAQLMCPFGTAPGTLNVSSQVTALGCSKPVATITDIALGSNKDADLLNRAYFSSQYGAEYFVSIHVNFYENKNINGIEIYKKDESSDEIANRVMDKLMELELAENRGIFDHSGLMVLRKNIAKSILVETGYISGVDYEYLKDDAELMRIADAIAKGIIEQLESDKKE